jgi:hypothetical protein
VSAVGRSIVLALLLAGCGSVIDEHHATEDEVNRSICELCAGDLDGACDLPPRSEEQLRCEDELLSFYPNDPEAGVYFACRSEAVRALEACWIGRDRCDMQTSELCHAYLEIDLARCGVDHLYYADGYARCGDGDRDGALDVSDECPLDAGSAPSGC